MTRSPHQQRVDQFMKLAGQKLPDKPILPDEETRLLRARLILEETLETLEALGFAISIPLDRGIRLLDHDFKLVPLTDQAPSLIEIADGCADIRVVTTGTLSACGIDDRELQEEVDQNNLAKFGPGGHRRADGKWVKPPDHKPPKIPDILRDQGWQG